MISENLRQLGVTDDELNTIACIYGPLENMYAQSLIQAVILLKLQKLEKRMNELETAKEDQLILEGKRSGAV